MSADQVAADREIIYALQMAEEHIVMQRIPQGVPQQAAGQLPATAAARAPVGPPPEQQQVQAVVAAAPDAAREPLDSPPAAKGQRASRGNAKPPVGTRVRQTCAARQQNSLLVHLHTLDTPSPRANA